MADNDWAQLLSDVAVLESESDDDEAFTEDEDEYSGDDDGEFDPVTLGVGALAARQAGRLGFNRRAPRRARPTGSYGQGVKGKGAGVVQTPSGPARIALPGNFPTVEEFRKTVGQIQKDMQANSTGIRELAEQQKKDVVRLADMITTGEKKLQRQMRRTQTATMIGILVPLAFSLTRKFVNP